MALEHGYDFYDKPPFKENDVNTLFRLQPPKEEITELGNRARKGGPEHNVSGDVNLAK